MDEYDDESDAAHCYVNPFVGEGRYAKYLRLWLDIVPSEQIMLLNFDEWTADAAATMRSVADFLMLGPHVFRVEEAHNTHLARSVHVAQHASSNASAVAADSIEEGMSFATHCVLHEFFRPYQQDLTALLREYGYPPMEWDTGRKGGYSCPSAYRHWKHLRGNAQ